MTRTWTERMNQVSRSMRGTGKMDEQEQKGKTDWKLYIAIFGVGIACFVVGLMAGLIIGCK